MVELEFNHPDYVNKAEKSWKLVANALETVLGCNVEMRINLTQSASLTNYAKKKPSFSLFSCSRRMWRAMQSITEYGSDPSDIDFTAEKAIVRNRYVETCSCNGRSRFSHNCCQRKEATKALRNNEGNVLSVGMTPSHRPLPDHIRNPALEVDSLKERRNCKCQAISLQEAEKQPGCFSRSLKLHKKMQSSATSESICTRFLPQTQSNLALSIPRQPSTEAYFCANGC